MIITAILPNGQPIRHQLTGERMTVGRAFDNDVVLLDHKLSRRHLAFVSTHGSWVIQDTGSRNGTYINGRPLLDSEHLREGDEIGLGDCRLVLERDPRSPDASCLANADTRDSSSSTDATPTGRRRVGLVGDSAPARELRQRVLAFAGLPNTVLITGETGTGKELVARLLHDWSPRREGPLVIVNCPAIPDELFEAEVFGVESGIATGVAGREGLLSRADRGTVFLDELGELALKNQAKLLRFLEDSSIDRVGSHEPRSVDVRVVAATNRNLQKEVDEGRFRIDLFHRVNALSIQIPPLRERRADVEALIQHFLELHPTQRLSMTPEAVSDLRQRRWPGNVRELRHVVEAAAAMARGQPIAPAQLPPDSGRSDRSPVDRLIADLLDGSACFWKDVRAPFLHRELSREAVREVVRRLHEDNGSYKAIASRLQIERDHKKLLNFLRDHGLRPND